MYIIRSYSKNDRKYERVLKYLNDNGYNYETKSYPAFISIYIFIYGDDKDERLKALVDDIINLEKDS